VITKRDILFWIGGFTFMSAFMAFASWCSGYNFDYRSQEVGFGVFISFWFSAFIGFCTTCIFKEVKP